MKLTYGPVSDEIYKMFKLSALSLFIATLTCSVFSKSGPVIRKEIKEQNGRKAEYMYIDGIKVHETDPEKQPQPPVVEPKPYDAKAAQPPKGAVVLFDGTPKNSQKLAGNQRWANQVEISGWSSGISPGGWLPSEQERVWIL